ncbi:Meprin A subunit beta [Collichthys lucidus]|uniref:Meprin A subunit beta n=1 Tax=Collichthys lucidus TaxID=240159 RepID=A0A4U5V3E4_COLLU|nr:Meprin A subunit beta [Collichthys lucidus]
MPAAFKVNITDQEFLFDAHNFSEQDASCLNHHGNQIHCCFDADKRLSPDYCCSFDKQNMLLLAAVTIPAEIESDENLDLAVINKDTSISFMEHCNFSNADICGMSYCKKGLAKGWKRMSFAPGKPFTDHTNLHKMDGKIAFENPRILGEHIKSNGESLYVNPSYGMKTFLTLEQIRSRDYLKGGTAVFLFSMRGSPKSYWQLHHVSLNATKHFQVVFESRKGAGSSSGGFSIDDINLSETECPHLTMQINDFVNLFNTSANARIIYSSRQYSRGGYAYRIGIVLYKSFFGPYVQLLSGKYDDQLEWPCVNRQVTFQMVDQNPNIQQQMSKQSSITTDLRQLSDGSYIWDNPRKVGNSSVENNETIFAGPLFGIQQFASLEDLNFREYLKGGSAAFVFSFQGRLMFLLLNLIVTVLLGIK